MRVMVENKLNNSQFIENAPKDVIDKQRKMKLDLSEQEIIMIQVKLKNKLAIDYDANVYFKTDFLSLISID